MTITGFADVVTVSDANVVQIGGGVNHIEFLNTANPIRRHDLPLGQRDYDHGRGSDPHRHQ